MISKLQKWVWAGAGTLTFSAGMVNVIALSSFTHKAATHVTGVASSFSMALVRRNFFASMETLLILLFFFAGAFMSGMIIRDGHLKMGRRYGAALAVEAILLLLATFFYVKGKVAGEYFACMSAGLQNALASTYSGTIVRTTHLTGVLTDLGVLMGSKLRGVAVETKKLKLLTIIFVSFIVGGLAGSLVYNYFGPWSMLLPALMITASAFGYELIRRHLAQVTASESH